MSDLEESGTQRLYDNAGFNSASVLHIRLDTSQIIERLNTFLSGKVHVIARDPRTGMEQVQIQQVGKPICNDYGVQQLVNFVVGIINNAVVQGNYDRAQYDNHLWRIHRNLAFILTVNYIEWGISKKDRKPIINYIMNIFEPFLSRLIDNKERESYAQSMRSVESRVEKGGGSGFNFFSRGGGQN